MTYNHDLLIRCQREDRAAWDELFQTCVVRVHRLAMTILRDEKDAEDATQETMLRVYRQIKTYRAEASFSTWLTTITVNVCRDHLRRQKLRRAISLEWLRGKPDVEKPGVTELVDQNMQKETLWTLVAQMDDAYRLPIVLVYQENLSVAEAAGILGIPVRTAYARLKHAYAELSDRLGSLMPLQEGRK